MPTPIPTTRIPTLKAALAKYKAGEQESMRALAKLYGVAASRFTTLIKDRFEGFPEAERIDRADWYPAREAIEAMIAYTVALKKGGRSTAGKRAAAIRGATSRKVAVAQEEDEGPEAMTPTELDRMASAMTRVFNLKKAMGEFVKRDEVKRSMRSAFSIFTHEVMAMPNLIDPNGQLPARDRQALEQKCREILTKVHGEMGTLLDLSHEDDQRVPAASSTPERHRRATAR